MTVDPRKFVDAMTKHWEIELSNITSNKLQAVWSQLATTFNDQIGRTNPKLWQVLQPPTGTGKSQGAAMYCSMLATLPTLPGPDNILCPSKAEQLHPGVLIVTRQIKDAEEMASQINKLANTKTAQASHSQNSLSEAEIISTPVLIITHSAYMLALSDASSVNGCGSQLEILHRWLHTERGLIIIDEAPELIEPTQVDIERLKQVLAHIPEVISNQFPAEIDYLNKVLQWMRSLPIKGGRDQMFSEHNMLSEQPDFTALRKAVKKRSLDRTIVNRRDDDANKSLHKIISDTLSSIEKLAGNWCMYAQSGEQGTINWARHILPDDHPGAVILDATASSNLLYYLFEHRVALIPTPEQARRYDQVTLHVSRGHRVGKLFLKHNAATESQKLADELRNVAANSESVFICCHKDVKPQLAKYDGFELGHWGAVDGLNDWQDCDTAVVFGLPYRNNIWAANAYMAVQGPQSTEWIAASGKRPFGKYSDILNELEIGIISANVIQVINRVRCRRVIDEHGNCPSTDVYILLPSGKQADEILGHIKTSMPGINTVDWAYSGATRKARKRKHAASLVTYLNNIIPGKITVGEIIKEVGIPKSTFEKLVPKIKDQTTQIYADLINIGVTYQVEGTGRGAKSYFVKT